MRPQPEAVLQLAATIVELKKRLAEAQAAWDSMFPEGTGRIVSIIPKGGRAESEDSGAGKIRALLNSDPGKTWMAESVSTHLGIPLSTTRTTLSKEVKRGRLEKRGFNGYGAVTKEKETTSEEIAS